MYVIKCNNLSKIQLQLTPQQSRSHFRVNAEMTKDSIEAQNTHKRVDVVKISPEGYQMLAKAILSGSWGLDQGHSQPSGHTYQVPPALRYSLPE